MAICFFQATTQNAAALAFTLSLVPQYAPATGMLRAKVSHGAQMSIAEVRYSNPPKHGGPSCHCAARGERAQWHPAAGWRPLRLSGAVACEATSQQQLARNDRGSKRVSRE